jgi:hypothetical protein
VLPVVDQPVDAVEKVLRSRGLPDGVVDELVARGGLQVRVPDRWC